MNDTQKRVLINFAMGAAFGYVILRLRQRKCACKISPWSLALSGAMAAVAQEMYVHKTQKKGLTLEQIMDLKKQELYASAGELFNSSVTPEIPDTDLPTSDDAIPA